MKYPQEKLLLIVDDDTDFQNWFSRAMRRRGFLNTSTDRVADALQLISLFMADYFILDLKLSR